MSTASSYMPASNEVVISGVPISSGGVTHYEIDDVIIPLRNPDGSPLTPSEFYVKLMDGTQIKVDPRSATTLYAASVAMNTLYNLYGKDQAQYSPDYWQNVETATVNSVNTQTGDSFLEQAITTSSALIVPGADVADAGEVILDGIGYIESAINSYQTLTNNNSGLKEIAIADAFLHGAELVLKSSYDEFISQIYDASKDPTSGITLTLNAPIDYNSIRGDLYNTVLALEAGQDACKALNYIPDYTSWPSLTPLSLLSTFASTAVETIAGFFGAAKSELVDAIAGSIGDLGGDYDIYQSAASAPDAATLEADLESLTSSEQSYALSALPFSASAEGKIASELASSPAENQGIVVGTPPPGTPAAPEPVISAKATDYTLVNTNLPLSLLFSASITNDTADDAIDRYTIVNNLEGPGSIVIDGTTYRQATLTDVTPNQFESAYFTASQAGSDEIDIIAYDTAGNESSLTGTTITVASSLTPPPTASSLKIANASITSSDLEAGGGGTLQLTVQNTGNNPAPNTAFSQIYLSSNATLDPSDALVSAGAISDQGLVAGASQTQNLSFTLPNNVVGPYYLIVFAGDSDQVANGGAAGNTYAMLINVTSTAAPPPPPPPQPAPPSPGPSPITIATDAPITTRVGSEPEFTSDNLLATDSQYSNPANLRYIIVSGPATGHLIDNFTTTSMFTQADIDDHLVDFVQNGTSTSSDSFTY